ncbi:MAG: LiaF transmembrane domain-containing protein [Halanaerobiaceae bacterium]
MKKKFFNITLGILIVLAGTIILLNNFGVIEMSLGKFIGTFWPLILVAWGMDILRLRENRGGVINGGALLLIGLLLLGRNLGLYSLQLRTLLQIFWPLVIIYLGFRILQGVFKKGGNSWAVMGGVERKEDGWLLESGGYTALMGGVELDLTKAKFAEDVVELDLLAVMGGIDVKVSEDINITCQGSAFLGGVSFLGSESGGVFGSRDFSHRAEEEGRELIIKARALLGGVEIMF